MNVHAFVFNWKGHGTNARALEEQLRPFGKVTVINSDESLRTERRWIHLDDTAYFSSQWNTALHAFQGDVLFHMQADATCDDLGRLLHRSTTILERHRAGVYEPDIDVTYYRYDTTRLRALEPQVYEVPVTDTTCWFVTRGILEHTPTIEVAVNKYGWGIGPTVSAIARASQQYVVRDYGVRVHHCAGRGYSSELAAAQREAYLRRLPPAIARQVGLIYRECERLRLPWPESTAAPLARPPSL